MPVIDNAIDFWIVIRVLNLVNTVEQRLIALVHVAVAVHAALSTAGPQAQEASTISPFGATETADSVTFADRTSSSSGRKPRGAVVFVSNSSSDVLRYQINLHAFR